MFEDAASRLPEYAKLVPIFTSAYPWGEGETSIHLFNL